VKGAYISVTKAKAALQTYPSASPPSRLICEVIDGLVQTDPHTVAGENQGGGVAAGWNKWWNDWDDINVMLDVCRSYITGHPIREYVLVEGNEVKGVYGTTADAKQALAPYPEGNPPSRMIVEVINGVVQSDPHTVNGENQGGGVSAGWNKWWGDWFDINRMLGVVRTYIQQKCSDGQESMPVDFQLTLANEAGGFMPELMRLSAASTRLPAPVLMVPCALGLMALGLLMGFTVTARMRSQRIIPMGCRMRTDLVDEHFELASEDAEVAFMK